MGRVCLVNSLVLELSPTDLSPSQISIVSSTSGTGTSDSRINQSCIRIYYRDCIIVSYVMIVLGCIIVSYVMIVLDTFIQV